MHRHYISEEDFEKIYMFLSSEKGASFQDLTKQPWLIWAFWLLPLLLFGLDEMWLEPNASRKIGLSKILRRRFGGF